MIGHPDKQTEIATLYMQIVDDKRTQQCFLFLICYRKYLHFL